MWKWLLRTTLLFGGLIALLVLLVLADVFGLLGPVQMLPYRP